MMAKDKFLHLADQRALFEDVFPVPVGISYRPDLNTYEITQMTYITTLMYSYNHMWICWQKAASNEVFEELRKRAYNAENAHKSMIERNRRLMARNGALARKITLLESAQ